ncbi:MAG: cardiolipin synthase [Tissierellia bacterium]|nr:cardiolipin synthase [Tissierellia bacterium]
MALIQGILDIVRIWNNLWWMNILMAIVVIILGRNKNPRSTLMWLMVLVFLPVVGFLLYLFLGQDYTKRKMFMLKEEQDRFITEVSLFQRDFISEGKFFYNNEKSQSYYDLIKMNLKLDESFYTQDNEISMFYWGRDKFYSLIKDLENANRSIDMQYYIFEDDTLGKRIIRVLERKAKEGLKVRLLYDGVGSRRLRKKTFERLIENGGQVAVFFPSIFPIFNVKLNYRNHRKIVVIDDEIGYVGGFNVSDDYLGLRKKFGPWRDTHARIVGSGVLGLKFRFLKDWQYAHGDKKDPVEPIVGSYNPNGHSGVQIVTSGPDTQFENVKNAYFKMITSAKEAIYIQTPYFVPDETIMDALKTAIISGIDVHIMIPRMPDHPFVYWATTSYAGELIKLGAKVYKYEKGFLHCKVLIVDDYIASVGSANMDIRSFALNFEVISIIYDEEINRDLRGQYRRDIENSLAYTEQLYRERGLIIKAKEAFSRLLSPIL